MNQPGLSRFARRVSAVAANSFTSNMAISAMAVILPIFGTEVLGLSNAGVARAISLRMLGITVGVIFLGGLGDRFGVRRMTILSLFGGGLCFAAMGLTGAVGFLILLPIMSGLVSTGFVNLNHLTQIASPRRQGEANTWYRAVGSVAAILAPVVTTWWFGQIRWVLAAMGVGLCLSALYLERYPLDERHEPFRGLRDEFRLLGRQYREAFRQRHLMLMVGITTMCVGCSAVTGAFLAIRLTRELGASTQMYGNACALASALTLGGILVLGAFLDRVSVRGCTAALMLAATGCVLAMGLTNSVVWTQGWLVSFTVASGISLGPLSMWISRESGETGISLAFSVQKTLMAAALAAWTFGLAWLEPRFGIRPLFVGFGAAGMVLSMSLFLLRNPPATERRGQELEPGGVLP